MGNFPLKISKDKAIHHFEVSEHPHHSGEGCKFRVDEAGKFVASFEPDAHDFLHICQNPGNVEEEVLHILADQIEAQHLHGINGNIIKMKL